MIQREPTSSQSAPTAAELEALLAAPPQQTTAPVRPRTQPEPVIRPRRMDTDSSASADEGYFFDPNDGTIKPKRQPEPERPAETRRHETPQSFRYAPVDHD